MVFAVVSMSRLRQRSVPKVKASPKPKEVVDLVDDDSDTSIMEFESVTEETPSEAELYKLAPPHLLKRMRDKWRARCKTM